MRRFFCRRVQCGHLLLSSLPNRALARSRAAHPFETTQCGSNHVYVTCDDHHIDFRLAVLNGTRKAEVRYVKRYIMRNARNFHRILFRVVPLGLLIGLALTATQAYGYSGGRHGMAVRFP